MITSVTVPPIAHVYNVVRLAVDASPYEVVTYDIVHAGTTIYQGSGVCDSSGRVEFNIARILARTVRSEHPDTSDILVPYPLLTAQYNISVSSKFNTMLAAGTAVAGGIGNDIYRRLVLIGKTIFQQRWLNNARNRVLTTKTGTRQLRLRETELTTLVMLFTSADRRITVTTHDGQAVSESLPTITDVQAFGINLPAVRSVLFTTAGRLYNEFNLLVDGTTVCTVTVLPSEQHADDRLIRYVNSFGVSEFVEVTGVMRYTPDLADTAPYKLYDSVVDDYELQRDRLRVMQSYDCVFNYKHPDELIVIQDVFQSENTWIEVDGVEYACILEADNAVLATDELEPLEVRFTLKLKDNSLGQELEINDIAEIFESEWLSTVCQSTDLEQEAEWSDFVCQTVVPAHIIFNANGGTPDGETTVNVGDLIPYPTFQPQYEGNLFKGWYIDAGGTTEWDFETDRVSGDMTLYAGWQPLILKILFESDNFDWNQLSDKRFTFTTIFPATGGMQFNASQGLVEIPFLEELLSHDNIEVELIFMNEIDLQQFNFELQSIKDLASNLTKVNNSIKFTMNFMGLATEDFEELPEGAHILIRTTE